MSLSLWLFDGGGSHDVNGTVVIMMVLIRRKSCHNDECYNFVDGFIDGFILTRQGRPR